VACPIEVEIIRFEISARPQIQWHSAIIPYVVGVGLGDGSETWQTAVGGTEIVNAREGELYDFKSRAF
jgi:hypothetical protein